MATNHTTNYQLNLWEPTDSFLREEFNENFQKLDVAAGTIPKIAVGTYTGNGSRNSFRTITLGFEPKMVMILESGTFSTNKGAIAVKGFDVKVDSSVGLKLTSTGFQFAGTTYSNQDCIPFLNLSGQQYHYFAIG